MTTFVGTQSDFGKVLGALVELSYDTIEAYTTAINRLTNEEFKEKLKENSKVLKDHIKEIDGILIEHGKNIPSGASIKQYLTKGKVALADIVGDDLSILRALMTTAQDLAEAFKRTSVHEDLWKETKEVIERGLIDAQDQSSWIHQATETPSEK